MKKGQLLAAAAMAREVADLAEAHVREIDEQVGPASYVDGKYESGKLRYPDGAPDGASLGYNPSRARSAFRRRSLDLSALLSKLRAR